MTPVVVKIGGSLVESGQAPAGFWEAIRALGNRRPVILVHGGGPQATRLARRLGHEPRIVHGRRVTTDLDLQIIKWTLCGSVNADLVADAHRNGLEAVGMTGADGGTVSVVRRPPWIVDGETVDFGWVGEIEKIRPHVMDAILKGSFLPVLGALGIGADGQLYNVNADTVAGAVAAAVGAGLLLLVTDSGGLFRPGSGRVPECSRGLYEDGIAGGWITQGMRVKLQVAFEALDSGVGEVYVVGPQDLADASVGTRVVPGGREQ